MTPKQAAAAIRQRANDFERAIADAVTVTAKQAHGEAVALSSGPYTTKMLRRLGHPYARRRPRPIGRQYPAMINVQTGVFRANWRISETGMDRDGSMMASVYNIGKIPDYLHHGTERMIARPLVRTVEAKIAPALKRRVETAVTRTLGSL